MYSKLAVFDFDSTLVNTPKPTDKNIDMWCTENNSEWSGSDWWTNKNSLDTEIFDINLNRDVIRDFFNNSKNKDCMVVMLTGRVNSLREPVIEILNNYGLDFDRYLFKRPNQLTHISKKVHMSKILDEFKTIKELEMWDDRTEHFNIFEDWGRYISHMDGIKFKLNRVIDGKPNG